MVPHISKSYCQICCCWWSPSAVSPPGRIGSTRETLQSRQPHFPGCWWGFRGLQCRRQHLGQEGEAQHLFAYQGSSGYHFELLAELSQCCSVLCMLIAMVLGDFCSEDEKSVYLQQFFRLISRRKRGLKLVYSFLVLQRPNGFLKYWCYRGYSHCSRHTFLQSFVDDVCQDRDCDTWTFLQKLSWYRIQSACLRSRFLQKVGDLFLSCRC